MQNINNQLFIFKYIVFFQYQNQVNFKSIST